LSNTKSFCPPNFLVS